MLAKISEKSMHLIRMALACGWLLLIFSLFYDPVSAWLTDPYSTWSPLHLKASVFEDRTCIRVQGVCLEERAYPLGNSLFWGLIVPGGVFLLLVFGHEFWRRICPLSFFSQIPRALGKQRQRKRTDPQTGQIRTELVKIAANSWLGRNYVQFQFFLLYVGVCARILFLDSNRLALGCFLIFTIGSAILIGYLYAGKTWCQYFCPMSPVQEFYGEPRGLLNSIAHEGERTAITQSMCRSVNADGTEVSACVACHSPCIDIDAERTYWERLKKPDYKFLYYSYAGLVVGFFLYYYLYSGSWAYLLSGAWSHQENQLETLFDPGFYLFNTPIPIPKLVAVPLTIGLCSVLSYFLGIKLEKFYKSYQLKRLPTLTSQQLQHQIFTLCTFGIFNFFFLFAGRAYIAKLPLLLQYLFNILLVIVSTLWLSRTWGRSSERYSRESLAGRLRQQLTKLQVDVSRFLEGRSLESLNADEVYVLAKILPGFTGDKRLQAYKGILRDSLEEGYVNSTSSLEVLQQMRQELGISEQEHLNIVTELGVEDPDLLDPNQQRTRENQLRLQSFRQRIHGLVTSKRRRGAKGLGRELLKVVKKEKSIGEVLQKDGSTLRSLSQEYGLTLEEEAQILAGLDENAQLRRRGNILLHQLEELKDRHCTLAGQSTSLARPHLLAGLRLLQGTLQQKQRLIAKGVLEILEQLEPGTETTQLALALACLSYSVLSEVLTNAKQNWQQRLNPLLLSRIEQQLTLGDYCPTEVPEAVMVGYLEAFLAEPDSFTKAVSLYLLAHCERDRARQQARQLLDSHLMLNPLVKETAQQILQPADASTISSLEKLLYLSSVRLLGSLSTTSLMDLAYQASLKQYPNSQTILEQGQFCQDLLLLINGKVEYKRIRDDGGIEVGEITAVELLNDLEVLAKTESSATLRSATAQTCLIVIEGSLFDNLLARDKDFSRKVIEQESRRLKQLVAGS